MLYQCWVCKLDIGISLGMPCETIAKNGYSVDGSTRLEMRLNLFRRCPVVYLMRVSICL